MLFHKLVVMVILFDRKFRAEKNFIPQKSTFKPGKYQSIGSVMNARKRGVRSPVAPQRSERNEPPDTQIAEVASSCIATKPK